MSKYSLHTCIIPHLGGLCKVRLKEVFFIMANERTNTAKWIESRKRWQINVQKDGVRKTFTSAKPGRTGQREANKKADEWLEHSVISTGSKVSVLYHQFLTSKKATTSMSNWRPMDGRWRNKIEPVIGTKAIGKLTTGDLQKVLDTALSDGYAKKSLQNLRADLCAFLKWARKNRYTTLTGEDLEVSKSAKKSEKRILQPKDVMILFNISTTVVRNKRINEEYINAYRLEVLTGLRPGEINGLQWSDWHGNRLELRRAINAYGETTTGKNDNARRVVYLSTLARQVLETQYEWTGPKSSVFCISNLQHYHSRWKRYCKVNGLPDIAPYEIRHTFVSISDSLPEAQMKKLVGHSQSMDTYGVYGHHVEGEGEEISRNLDNIFSKILKNG